MAANVFDLTGGMPSGRRSNVQEQLAQALFQQGISNAPVRHPLEGLGRIAQALGGAFLSHQAGQRQAEQETRGAQALMKAASTIGAGVPAWTNPDTGETMGNAVAPGMASLQAVMASNPDPSIARALPQLMQVAQAYEKEKPKAPTITEIYDDHGRPQKGYMLPDGTFKPVGGAKPRDTVTMLSAQEKQALGIPGNALAQRDANGKISVTFPPQGPGPEPLHEVYDPNSTTQTTLLPRSQAIGKPGKPPSGMELTTNPDGTVSLKQGRQGMGNKTVSDLEEKIRNATDGLARVDQIGKSFKPEYQQLGTRWSAMATAVKEKVGFEPDPESKSALADFSRFKREALNNLNLYIKEITGAAMSNAEAERITRALPNPGVGLMDGDSPTEFQAKMESVQRELRAAVGRANYALKNGLSPMSIPLDQVPMLMRERAQQIQGEVDITQPGLDPEAKAVEVKRRLAVEFGLK